MNLKCLIGLHKWVKHKYTRFLKNLRRGEEK
jgi:hypothetical protein